MFSKHKSYSRSHAHGFLAWLLFLNFLAGTLNAYAYLSFNKAVSHQSGNFTQIAIKLVYSPVELNILLAIVFSYFAGALFLSILGHKKRYSLKNHYGIWLIFLSLPLFFLALSFDFLKILENRQVLALSFAFILGTQNALFIRYRDLLVRSTHLTGYLTDLAYSLGQIIRTLLSLGLKKAEQEQLLACKFYAMSIMAFVAGASFEAYFYLNLPKYALLASSVCYFIVGLYHYLWRHLFLWQYRYRKKKLRTQNKT